MPSIREILHEIRNLNEESIPQWIAKGVNSLTPEMLEKAIMENQDPLLIAGYLNLENPLIKIVAKTLLKTHWERIHFTFKDHWELYNQVSKDPEKKKLLDTPVGQAWLIYVRERCNEYYYIYTWDKCPRCKSQMDHQKTKSGGGTYICRKCGHQVRAWC